MSTITTRSGKGSPLTHNEVDANFTNLNTDKYQSGDDVTFGSFTSTGIDDNATETAITIDANENVEIEKQYADLLFNGEFGQGRITTGSGAAGGFSVENVYGSSGVNFKNNGAVEIYSSNDDGITGSLTIDTSGNTTVNGFTSTGIDDNATSTAITINSDEEVGISAINPQKALHVVGGILAASSDGSTSGITIDSTATAGYASTITHSDTGIEFDTGSTLRDFTFEVSGSELMRIDTSSGNVGIGNTETFQAGQSLSVGAGSSNSGVTIYSGTASQGRIYFGDTTTGAGQRAGQLYYDHSNDSMFIATGGDNPRVTVNSSGLVGIGTTDPKTRLQSSGGGTLNAPSLGSSSTNAPLYLTNNDTAYGLVVGNSSADGHVWLQAQRTDGTATAYNITLNEAGGNVGIGTDSPSRLLHLSGGDEELLRVQGNSAQLRVSSENANSTVDFDNVVTGGNISFSTVGSERMRIDDSGRVGIGVTSPQRTMHINGGATRTDVQLTLDGFGEGIANGVQFGVLSTGAYIWNFENTELYFATNNTRRVTIDSSGNLLVGQTNASTVVDGAYFRTNGSGFVATNTDCLMLNRQGTDGTVVDIRHANTTEGSISVSGTTVSYNGGHLSRWSQSDTDDVSAIYKGTVMSNLDEMCEWDNEDNEQLNKTKVSDVEGDVNVAGIFVAKDNSDDLSDYYLAMTGDMIIRIAQGTTVQRGDLLMSAGDGTAKPQDDDIVRSKTIAKVTSTNVTCTYADGSYCVPCVLMAC
jgi:hypothetical protein